jgi:hypothetical protein
MSPVIVEQVNKDDRYGLALGQKNYPQCFSRIEDIAGRKALEQGVAAVLNAVTAPGKMARCLADWPLGGYVTTNYDQMIETALKEIRQSGWVPVGNSADEVRKVSGDTNRVVWHIHGGLALEEGKSRLVLTEEDYDNFYLDGSPLATQLLTPA